MNVITNPYNTCEKHIGWVSSQKPHFLFFKYQIAFSKAFQDLGTSGFRNLRYQLRYLKLLSSIFTHSEIV